MNNYNFNYFNRILVMGFRGVGKSTISKHLAKAINFECVDMDLAIEEDCGKKINDITNNGRDWQTFRQLELIKIRELLNFDNIVISAGGGLGVNDILFDNTFTYGDLQRELILQSKDTLKILLTADEDIIRERLHFIRVNYNTLPDLREITSNIEEYVENNIKIMRERKEHYEEMADLIFDVSNNDLLENVDGLLKLIKNYKK